MWPKEKESVEPGPGSHKTDEEEPEVGEKDHMQERKGEKVVVECPNVGTKRKIERAEMKGMKKKPRVNKQRKNVFYMDVSKRETNIHSQLTDTKKVKEIDMNGSSNIIVYETNLKTPRIYQRKFPVHIVLGLREATRDSLQGQQATTKEANP